MNNKPLGLKDLAVIGAKYEQKLNSLIQEKLDDKRSIHFINVGIQQHVKILKVIRQFNELIAQQLNIPTKDGVAGVARIAMQLEEKLDQIEELLLESNGQGNGKVQEQTQSDEGDVLNSSATQPALVKGEMVSFNRPEDLSSSQTFTGRIFTLLKSFIAEEFFNHIEKSLEDLRIKRRRRSV